MSSTTGNNEIYDPERPGCVTALAVIMWLGSALFLLGIVSDPGSYIVCSGVVVITLMVMGLGIWYMQKWAWWLVVITQSWGAVYAVLMLIVSLFFSNRFSAIILPAIAMAIFSGAILYWFIDNRYLFDGPYTYQTTVASDGRRVTEHMPISGKKTTRGVLIAVVVVFSLIPLLLSILPLLLGPQIAELFKQISSNLSTP